MWRQVVVSTDGANGGTLRSLEALSHAAPETAQGASIVFYDSLRVTIRAILERPGIVILTDSDYPGWTAYLDGSRVPVLAANYLFRGVLAPAGTHQIEFRYEPQSYLYGPLISLLALSSGLAWFGATTRRQDICVRGRLRVRNGELEADA
jgi:hypothetical protein